ncbi:MAG: prephenate dehydratase [Clostridia bacterium]|nr:prephenate dehydratase [Clostridia bacterium]
MLKVGYLGPKGTFSYEAVLKYTKNMECFSAIDYSTIEDILLAVQNDEIHEAVVPMENSIEGAINATMDMIATEVDLTITGELVIPVQQNLLAKEGAELSNIRYVLSHPQPIGQCRKFLNNKLPGAQVRVTYSTAGAAEEVAAGGNELAAIGSETAAEVYGLNVLARGIQDKDNNFTRFVILSKGICARTGDDKTSIVFSTENKPGSLYRILDIFNLWDINMTRIESRPAKRKLGRYIFFVDIKGHQDDEDVRDALTMVKRKSSFYKFLGSYPEYKES